jgi:hypothetical protein
MLEALAVTLILGIVVFGAVLLLLGRQDQPPAVTGAGEWRVAHYDVKGATRVTLQKVARGAGNVLDEHVIAEVDGDDPEYDAKFLAAMDTARERRAMFQVEEE